MKNHTKKLLFNEILSILRPLFKDFHKMPVTLAILLLLTVMLLMAAIVAQAQDNGAVWNVPRSGGETITEPSPEATALLTLKC